MSIWVNLSLPSTRRGSVILSPEKGDEYGLNKDSRQKSTTEVRLG